MSHVRVRHVQTVDDIPVSWDKSRVRRVSLVVALFASVLIAPEAQCQTPTKIYGFVRDSLNGGMLRGATVHLVGISDEVIGRHFVVEVDSGGRYMIPNVIPGVFSLGFTHALFDSLGIEIPLRRVTVTTADQSVDLATPSAATIRLAMCPQSAQSARGVLFGHVFGTQSGEPVPQGTPVVSEWPLHPVATSPVVTDTVRTGEGGIFVVCGVPEGTSLISVHTVVETAASGRIPIQIEALGLHHVTLVVGNARFQTIKAEGSSGGSATVLRGDYVVEGIAKFKSGLPASSTTISIAGTGLETRTDNAGHFTIRNAPGGSQLIEARRIGLVPVSIIANIGPASPTTLSVEMDEAAVALPNVDIRGANDLAAFEQRKKTSTVGGTFLDPDEIARRPPRTPLTSLVQAIPGLRKVCRARCTLEMRRMSSVMSSSGTETCRPFLFVDGRRQRLPELEGDFDFLDSSDIAAIEVYTREAQVPTEFIVLAARRPCGVIAVWTKRKQ